MRQHDCRQRSRLQQLLKSAQLSPTAAKRLFLSNVFGAMRSLFSVSGTKTETHRDHLLLVSFLSTVLPRFHSAHPSFVPLSSSAPTFLRSQCSPMKHCQMQAGTTHTHTHTHMYFSSNTYLRTRQRAPPRDIMRFKSPSERLFPSRRFELGFVCGKPNR